MKLFGLPVSQIAMLHDFRFVKIKIKFKKYNIVLHKTQICIFICYIFCAKIT